MVHDAVGWREIHRGDHPRYTYADSAEPRDVWTDLGSLSYQLWENSILTWPLLYSSIPCCSPSTQFVTLTFWIYLFRWWLVLEASKKLNVKLKLKFREAEIAMVVDTKLIALYRTSEKYDAGMQTLLRSEVFACKSIILFITIRLRNLYIFLFL